MLLLGAAPVREPSAAKYDELLTLRKITKTQSETIKIQMRIIQRQKEDIKYLRHIPCDGQTVIAE